MNVVIKTMLGGLLVLNMAYMAGHGRADGHVASPVSPRVAANPGLLRLVPPAERSSAVDEKSSVECLTISGVGLEHKTKVLGFLAEAGVRTTEGFGVDKAVHQTSMQGAEKAKAKPVEGLEWSVDFGPWPKNEVEALSKSLELNAGHGPKSCLDVNLAEWRSAK